MDASRRRFTQITLAASGLLLAGARSLAAVFEWRAPGSDSASDAISDTPRTRSSIVSDQMVREIQVRLNQSEGGYGRAITVRASSYDAETIWSGRPEQLHLVKLGHPVPNGLELIQMVTYIWPRPR